MRETTFYFCDFCRESFRDKEEFRMHEVQHQLCRCLGGIKGDNKTSMSTNYAERTRIDFDIPAIIQERREGEGYRILDKIFINYCPFCGRKIGEQK